LGNLIRRRVPSGGRSRATDRAVRQVMVLTTPGLIDIALCVELPVEERGLIRPSHAAPPRRHAAKNSLDQRI
jgi:gentisate 1,2-dioxygenase